MLLVYMCIIFVYICLHVYLEGGSGSSSTPSTLISQQWGAENEVDIHGVLNVLIVLYERYDIYFGWGLHPSGM